MPQRLSLSTIGLLLFLSLTACQPRSNPPTVTATRVESLPSPVAHSTPTQPATATATLIPTATPTQPWCSENGRIEQTEIPSNKPTEPLVVRIYLPPCYQPQPETPYPVLIMIHGQTYVEDQWDRLGIDEVANELILSQEIPPFLIFMPLERHTDREPGETNFDNVVVDYLLPWIKETYPVCQDRACWAIGGLSRGATWAVHLGFQRPELFGSIGGHSLTPFYGDVYALRYWILRAGLENLPRFYLDMGQKDIWYDAFTEFADAMKTQNVVFDLSTPEGEHAETYWAAHVEEYVRWYAQAWQP